MKKKKSRKENKQIRMRNKKLCKKYPWLIPRNRFTDKICWINHPYDCTELDDMPTGWRKAFGNIWCEEIQKILIKNNYVKEFRISQLKEKYGSFRQYFNYHYEELSDLIWAFEIISEHVCVRCGKLDSPVINNYGWYEPLCKKCYDDYKSKRNLINNISYEERLIEAKHNSKEDMMIPLNLTINTYTKANGNQERIIDISNLVTKIRHKNRRRRSNVE